jgi:hypothetical protein
MKLSFNTCHFVLLVATTSTVTSAAEKIIPLGVACEFAVLAKAGVTNVPTSNIIGDIGVSPIAATALTGFALELDASAQFASSTQVTGQISAASYGAPISGKLTAAVAAMEAAFTEGNNRVATYADNLGGGIIGGKTLYSGVYKFTSTISIDQDITFDAQDDPNAVFIVTTTKELGLAAGKKVLMAGGARADNIFWNVMEGATLGADSHMEGNVLSATRVDFKTGSYLHGRAYAKTAVALDTVTIIKPTDCGDKKPDPFLSACTSQ